MGRTAKRSPLATIMAKTRSCQPTKKDRPRLPSMCVGFAVTRAKAKGCECTGPRAILGIGVLSLVPDHVRPPARDWRRRLVHPDPNLLGFSDPHGNRRRTRVYYARRR